MNITAAASGELPFEEMKLIFPPFAMRTFRVSVAPLEAAMIIGVFPVASRMLGFTLALRRVETAGAQFEREALWMGCLPWSSGMSGSAPALRRTSTLSAFARRQARFRGVSPRVAFELTGIFLERMNLIMSPMSTFDAE